MVDSCLLLCSNYSYGPVNLSPEMTALRDITCEDPWYKEQGNIMFDWINETLS